MLKKLQQSNTKEGIFHESFETNWKIHNAYFLQTCPYCDVPDDDKLLFFRYFSVNESDARQYYDSIILNCK